jgi:phosphohistidine phosphatase
MAVDYDRHLYLAPAETLLDFVREADDIHGRLLIVGHNPGMEQLALLLAPGGALRDRLAAKYPTGALARISLPAARWRDVDRGSGTLDLFLRPRDLAPGLGPDD